MTNPGLFGQTQRSGTSQTVALGTATFTLDVDDDVIQTDYTVQIVSNADPDCWMYGVVTSKTSPDVTVGIFKVSDVTGTFSDWTLQVVAGPFAGLPASQTLGFSAVSASVPAVGDSLSWTIEAGKTFYDNSTVYVSAVTDPTAFFFATVVSYNSGTGAIKLVVNRVGGSGTQALWTIVLIDVQSSFWTSRGNANYTIKPSDKIVALTTALTASRTWTLPSAAAVPVGYELVILDTTGSLSSTKVLTINPAGADTINGTGEIDFIIPYGRLILTSDASSNWSYDYQTTGEFFGTVNVHFDNNILVDGSINLQGGQLIFPATQNASSDANTLDDYAEGTYTPVVSFSTPGTSSFTYATQSGRYTKIGRLVHVAVSLTFTPTVGTGSGTVQISLPFTPTSSTPRSGGVVLNLNSAWTWPAGRTSVSVVAQPAGAAIRAVGSASGLGTFSATNLTSGSSHDLDFTVTYTV